MKDISYGSSTSSIPSIRLTNTKRRTTNRVPRQHARGKEQVRVDQVVHHAQENENHPGAEGDGTDDGGDPVDLDGHGGPGEDEEADSILCE